ncbi:MAG: nucleoside-diphosphate kinase [Nanoarchaeota archaeon]|nr:nucleoside-diphosphate kinase [Nanoarchaeota archaeon]
MQKMTEKTLVLIKPDGIERSLIGECIKRFEQRGLKIIGLKMVWTDKDHAMKHYTDDISKRRGEHVRKKLLTFITSGPVVAIAIEGVDAIENVRKIVGSTEPKSALPGTIRGDFAHVSYSYADSKDIAVKNLIHASGNKEDADYELPLWFNDNELHTYHSVHDKHIKE